MNQKNIKATPLDKNMLPTAVDRKGLVYYDAESEPFRIYGIWRQNGAFARIPSKVCAVFDKTLAPEDREKEEHRSSTAGGRIRFITDSPYVAVNVLLEDVYMYFTMSITGTCGLDLYADGEFVGSYRPPLSQKDGYFEALVDIGGERRKRVITLNLPLYCNVEKIYIGLDENATIERAPDYKYEKPVVFYGSSITHGACASRPGMNYPAQIGRLLDCNHHNLGFGGCAKAEPEVAEYIAGLDMSVFVYDYDHNAPDAQYLKETHERMFKTVRDKNPELPIVMISAPYPNPSSNWIERREIIRETYEKALAAGDKNVYFISGTTLFPELGADFTPDGTHPSDLGYYYMARRIAPVISKILDGAESFSWQAPEL